MKIVKLIMFLFVIGSSNLSQGQEILKKWEDLNIFSSILTKVNYIASEGNFEVFSEYSSSMIEFTRRLSPENMPKELRTTKSDEELTKLGAYIKEFDVLAKRKAGKSELEPVLKKLNESYNNFVTMVKVK
jgi:hypothetical protein